MDPLANKKFTGIDYLCCVPSDLHIVIFGLSLDLSMQEEVSLHAEGFSILPFSFLL